MPPLALLPLAADFVPIDASFQVNAMSVIILIASLVGIWAATRRKPPLDAHLVKLEAAIESLQVSVRELSETQKSHARHAAEIEALQLKVATLEQRREGDLTAQRTYTRETTRELFEKIESNARITHDKLDAVTNSMHALFRDVAADIGALKAEVKNHG